MSEQRVFDFEHLQDLYPTSSQNDSCNKGSNLFGVDLAISANGNTIVVVEGELVEQLAHSYYYTGWNWDLDHPTIAGGKFGTTGHGLVDGDIVRYSYNGPGNVGPGHWGYDNLTDDSDPTDCHWSTRHYTVVNADNDHFELRRGFMSDEYEGNPENTEDDLLTQWSDDSSKTYPILITANDDYNVRSQSSLEAYDFHNFTKIGHSSNVLIRPAKICTYRRTVMGSFDVSGGTLVADCNNIPDPSYELVDSFLIPDPVAKAVYTRASIDLSDKGDVLIVGSPDNGRLLDYLALDQENPGSPKTVISGSDNYWDEPYHDVDLRGKATGEWRVYDWVEQTTTDNKKYHTWVQRGDTGTVLTDSSEGQEIGTMVSISFDGNTAVVSTNIDSAESVTTTTVYEDDSNRGFVYVYDWVDSAWVQRGPGIRDISNEHAVKLSGYPRYFSIDAKADYIAISTYRYDPASTQSFVDDRNRYNYGAVRVFVYNDTGDPSTSAWVQIGNIISPVPDNDYATDSSHADLVSEAEDTYFGNVVCLSKDNILPTVDDSGQLFLADPRSQASLAVMDINSVYVYDYDSAAELITGTNLDVINNTVTISGHVFQNGDMVRYHTEGVTEFGPEFQNLTNGVYYEVIEVSGDTFKLKSALGGYINFTSDDADNISGHWFATMKWVQRGNTISRGNAGNALSSPAGEAHREFVGEWSDSSVTSQHKSPSIAFSEDKNTIIIGDYTPLKDGQRGLVRTLRLVDDTWVESDDKEDDRLAGSTDDVYHFGTDVLVSREGESVHNLVDGCDDYNLGNILVFSEPLKQHNEDWVGTGQVQIYRDVAAIPAPLTGFPVNIEARAGNLLGKTRKEWDDEPVVSCGGQTNATEITFRFIISGGTWLSASDDPSYSTLLQASDWTVTKGVLASESFTMIPLDRRGANSNFIQFEGVVTVSNPDKEGDVILHLPKSTFADQGSIFHMLQKVNEPATCTIQYNPSPPPPPLLCDACPRVVANNYTVKFAASVSPPAFVSYYLQFRDRDENGLYSEWTYIYPSHAGLPTDPRPSAEVQSISTLYIPEPFECGDLPFGGDPDVFDDSKTSHQDCTKRIFAREFRCVAKHMDTEEKIYSDTFKLYQYIPTWTVNPPSKSDPTTPDPDPDPSWRGDWVREFTTTSEFWYDFARDEPAIGKVGDPTDKLIVSRLDMIRTNDTSGLNAFAGVMTRFKLCPALIVPKYRNTQVPAEQRYYGFQRLLVSSAYYPRGSVTPHDTSNRGAIQHYVAGPPGAKFYSTQERARQSLKDSSHWFFEDRPLTETNEYTIHKGASDDAKLGYSIAPTRSKDPRPGCGGPAPYADVPTGFWFMDGTKLKFEEAYGRQVVDGEEPVYDGDADYGHLQQNLGLDTELLDRKPPPKKGHVTAFELGLDGLGILSASDTTAQIATDGNGDTVAVSAANNTLNKKVSVFRTFGGVGHESSANSIHEIFTLDDVDHEVTHWRPNSLCLNDAGNILGYTYRVNRSANTAARVAIWEILGGTDLHRAGFSDKPANQLAHYKSKLRNVGGLFGRLGIVEPASNLSVLKMDKSGDNIIVSCTIGAVKRQRENPWLTPETLYYTGWAQVLQYNKKYNLYVPRGQRLEGPYKQFGIDCDISSDGNSIVVSSCEADESSSSFASDATYNRHGAIRCYTWSGSSQKWEQLGKTIRGTNWWSNLGFHLSYEADHVQRIAAFEGTDQNDSSFGDISMYKFEEKS